jgi:uncharacterized membrane protein
MSRKKRVITLLLRWNSWDLVVHPASIGAQIGSAWCTR